MGLDPKGKQYLLSPDVSDKLLGEAVLDALTYSRHLTLQECGVFLITKPERLITQSGLRN